MSIEFDPGRENKKSPLEALRGKMWKALLLGSSTLLFQACETTREQIDAMPKTSIEDINKNAKAFGERLIKTEGYIEDLGEKQTTEFSVSMSTDAEGNVTFSPSTDTKYVHTYNLREDVDPKSAHVGMVTIEGLPSRTKYPPKDKFEIVGTVRQKDGKYVIFLVHTFDLTTAVPEKK